MNYINRINSDDPYRSMRIYECLDNLERELVAAEGVLNFSKRERKTLAAAIEKLRREKEGYLVERLQISLLEQKPVHFLTDRRVPHFLDEDFTYVRPWAYDYRRGGLREVKSFKELYVDLLSLLFEKEPEAIREFVHQSKMNGRTRSYFASSPDGMDSPVYLSDGLYMETKFSANAIRDMIRKVFRELGKNDRDLRLYFAKEMRGGVTFSQQK